jgi:UDP-N-acetylmuramoylalanine--D-glutamate ligase
MEDVVILGLARSGKAVAELLARKGYRCRVHDDAPGAVDRFFEEVSGTDWADRLDRVDRPGEPDRVLRDAAWLIPSPGVPEEHPWIVAARRMDKPVLSELEVAFRFFRGSVVAVTGTNGKSTVTTLVGSMMEADGRKVAVAGNIGKPFASVVVGQREELEAVLEVSSFQLDGIERFAPRAAAILNVTPDHLDRYGGDFDRYARSKARILENMSEEDTYVYNAADAVCRRLAEDFSGRAVPFSVGAPLDGAERQTYERAGTLWLRWDGEEVAVIDRKAFTPMGVHNTENALAAIALATARGCGIDAVRQAIQEFHPLPHRMELVRVVGGVAYVNDSKATNPDAVVKSLRSIEGPVILILGGKDKGGDFGVLAGELHRTRLVVLIGEAADRIEKALEGRAAMERCATLEEAVRRASRWARAGDTVLLAPGCASFDMFADYAERGEAFRRAVRSLGG